MRNEIVTVLVALSNAWGLTVQAADFPEPTKVGWRICRRRWCGL